MASAAIAAGASARPWSRASRIFSCWVTVSSVIGSPPSDSSFQRRAARWFTGRGDVDYTAFFDDAKRTIILSSAIMHAMISDTLVNFDPAMLTVPYYAETGSTAADLIRGAGTTPRDKGWDLFLDGAPTELDKPVDHTHDVTLAYVPRIRGG